MFEDVVRETAIAQVYAMKAQLNKTVEDKYLTAARNWALNPDSPYPAVPFITDVQLTGDNPVTFTLVPTDIPISTIKPEDFLPKYKTDDNAVGGPVGGPIPDQPGRFYLAANASAYIGQIARVGGSVYVCQANGPFSRFWQKI